MKKFALFLLAAITCALCQAQDFKSGIIFGGSDETTFNTQDFHLDEEITNSPEMLKKIQLRRTPRKGSENSRWIDRIINMPSYLQSFYDDYAKTVQRSFQTHDGWLLDPTDGATYEDGRYTVLLKTRIRNTTVQVSDTSDYEEVARQKVKSEIATVTNEFYTFMHYLVICLTCDFPETFWLDSTFKWGYSWTYSYSVSGTTETISYTLKLYDILSDTTGFNIQRSCYASKADILSDMDQYNSAILGILQDIPASHNRYEVVKYLDNWLTHNNYYNPYFESETNSKYAWSPISALLGMEGQDAPVCEGYARAFKVLCDRLDIPCQIATGMARESNMSTGESHMWNEVMMCDNYWYAVDVTWDDPIVYDLPKTKVSGYECTDWLLLGSKHTDSCGMTFADSHPNSITWDVDSQYTDQWNANLDSYIALFDYNDATGITRPAASATSRAYDLSGRAVRQSTPNRIIIRNGVKTITR